MVWSDFSSFFCNGHHTSIFHKDSFTNINFLLHFPRFWDMWIILAGKKKGIASWKQKKVRGVWLVQISTASPAVLYPSWILSSWFLPQGPIRTCFRDLNSSLSPPKCLSPSFIRVSATETLSSKHMLFLWWNWPLLGHVWEVNISQLLEQMR